jgi:DeoR/GlpR family transcriptional regulator of sugar metabolism
MIVADHSKFGRLSLAFLCGLDAIGELVVDPGLSGSDRAMLEAAGVKVHLAPFPEETNGSSRVNGSRTES